jgi:hypothetical protein
MIDLCKLDDDAEGRGKGSRAQTDLQAMQWLIQGRAGGGAGAPIVRLVLAGRGVGVDRDGDLLDDFQPETFEGCYLAGTIREKAQPFEV